MDLIEEVKNLMSKQFLEERIANFTGEFFGVKKCFFWSNENIKDTLNLVEFSSSDNVLTVSGSGDHAFNLITKGVRNITLFDVNILSKYFVLGLKRALILQYNYEEFLKVIKILTSPTKYGNEIIDIIISSLPFMEEEYRNFWKQVLNIYKIFMQVNVPNFNLINILFINLKLTHATLLNNNYLASEENYNILRNNLAKVNISFENLNVIDINRLNKKFDKIILSNILDYMTKFWGYNWNYEKLLEFEMELEKISSSDCIIFLHYLFNFYSKSCNKFLTFYNDVFYQSIVELKDLQTEQIIPIPENNGSAFYDCTILKRVK